MSEPLCACGQLWKTPVENQPVSRARDSISLSKDKSLDSDEIVDALVHGLDLVTARVDQIEYQLLQLVSIVDLPLSPAEALERLRELREGMI